MNTITREVLHAFLDDALSEVEMSRIERAARESPAVRKQLEEVQQGRDRGEHSLGAIWRRERLTCPKREELSQYLLEVLDEERQSYVAFHLETVGCAFCLANFHDLEALQQEAQPAAKERRKRYFTSSAGLLQTCGKPTEPNG